MAIALARHLWIGSFMIASERGGDLLIGPMVSFRGRFREEKEWEFFRDTATGG
jgi:hypothetical protein